MGRHNWQNICLTLCPLISIPFPSSWKCFHQVTLSSLHIIHKTYYPDFKLNSTSYINVNSPLKESSNNHKVYNQNIRGLKGKTGQLSNILYSELPHLLCINVHHLKYLGIETMSTKYYNLGAKFCRHQYKNKGVCIFVHESIDFNTFPTHNICKENDLEICAVKLNPPKIKIVIITIYRMPSGNYNYFLRRLESLLSLLYIEKKKWIYHLGYININYLDSHNRRQQLDTLLAMYNLKSTVNFPMRIFNSSNTAIDNFLLIYQKILLLIPSPMGCQIMTHNY